MNRWKTIITHLLDWTTSWIKTVEFSNRLIKWICIPRKDFKNSSHIQELQNSWIYFLVWEDKQWNECAYIWQAICLHKRISDHNKDIQKDFRNAVIIFTHKDWTLNESDINYLEKQLISNAKNAGRYKINNWNNGNTWLIPQYRLPDMIEFIDDLKTLLATLWYTILKEIISKETIKNDANVYYLQVRWSNAKWIYTEEWFVVLKWSTWPIHMQDAVINKKAYAFRNRPKLLDKWIIKEVWNSIEFIKDHIFTSPSWASDLIGWWSFNWWHVRKNKDWLMLSEVERTWK
jgi:hypothetical protein